MKTQFKKSMVLALTALTMTQSLSHLVLETVSVYAEGTQQTSSEINRDALAFIAKHADDDYTLEWPNTTPSLALTEAQRAELKTFVNRNILGDQQLNDMQKIKLIFRWIVMNVKYSSPTDTPAINPYDVFTRKVAVCGGFSNLYKALLNAADVPSVIVYGTIPSESSVNGYQLDPAHQWNAVYADGEWFYSDSTWGEAYFHKSIEDFSKDHRLNAVQDVNYEENGIVYGFSEGGLSVSDFDESAEHVVIPDTSEGRPIVALATTAHSDKTALKTLVLGKNLTRFEAAAFDTGKLESIEVDPANPLYESKEGVLFAKGLKSIVYYPKFKQSTTFTIPKETENYDEKETFQNGSLKTLLVEEGNPNFSSYEGVLYNKDMTEVLTVPAAAEKVVIVGTARLNNHILSFKPSIKEVVIEEGVTEIPENLFYETNNLRKVTLPKSVTTISNKAFSASNLANITIVGDADSAIERFAKDNKLKFIERSADSVDTEIADATADTTPKQDLDANGNEKPDTNAPSTNDGGTSTGAPSEEKDQKDGGTSTGAPSEEKDQKDGGTSTGAPSEEKDQKDGGTSTGALSEEKDQKDGGTSTGTPSEEKDQKDGGTSTGAPSEEKDQKDGGTSTGAPSEEKDQKDGGTSTGAPSEEKDQKDGGTSTGAPSEEKDQKDGGTSTGAPSEEKDQKDGGTSTGAPSEGNVQNIGEISTGKSNVDEQSGEVVTSNNGTVSDGTGSEDMVTHTDDVSMAPQPESRTTNTNEVEGLSNTATSEVRGENLSPLPSNQTTVVVNKESTETKTSTEQPSHDTKVGHKGILPETGEYASGVMSMLAFLSMCLGVGVSKKKNKK